MAANDPSATVTTFSITIRPEHLARWLTARDGDLPSVPPAAGDPVPSSFLFFLRSQPATCRSIYELLGRDPHRALFGGVVYDRVAPVHVGDTLVGSVAVTAQRTVPAERGELTLTTLTTTWTDEATGHLRLAEIVQMIELPPGADETPTAGPAPRLDAPTLVEMPPVTRTQMAWMTVETGDTNALHLDPDYARSRRFPDVVVPGTLVVAMIERELAPDPDLPQRFEVRLRAPSYPGEVVELRVAGDGADTVFEAVVDGAVRAEGRLGPRQVADDEPGER